MFFLNAHGCDEIEGDVFKADGRDEDCWTPAEGTVNGEMEAAGGGYALAAERVFEYTSVRPRKTMRTPCMPNRRAAPKDKGLAISR